MNESQREQVLANAKYLQQVRPIDPEEICEYVIGNPHPAAVRQVLRESALDLGFLERNDGTFVPASDEPIDVDAQTVEAFPAEYATALEDLLVEAFGPGWPDGETGDEIRGRIREVKARYLRKDAVEYDHPTALGYAIYHLPATYASARYVLGGLGADRELTGTLHVLDVGAGVGGPALGLADLVGDETLVDYHAVEPSAAADVLEALLEGTGSNFHPTIHRERAEDFDPDDEFDLVVLSNVLSELAGPAAVAERYLGALDAHGTLAAIAPADRETALGLREVERTLEADAGATVYAPTVRLWPGYRPESDSWSFDAKADLDVPAFQRRLDEGERARSAEDDTPGNGEFVNADVQYAYSLLRRDGERRIDFVPDGDRLARMADAERHVTERIDCVGIKLSHDLAAESGGNPLYLVGDGSQRIDHFATLVEETALNADLRSADYGDPVAFENVLVLWNDDEDAYNLVVDGETVVDRIPP